ncbi:hypothetical protein ON010_g10233 [Phytophthora cinnamomi]|nr:hypothetical protein ON010_g10233 [Phytophthora cinnamomi]
MSDTSTLGGSTSMSLKHASFPRLLLFEWEALQNLAAVSGDSAVKTLLTAGTEQQQRLVAQEFMARELADVLQPATTPTLTKNKTDIVKLDVSTYSGEGEGRLHLTGSFCVVEIAIEARLLSTELVRTRFRCPIWRGNRKNGRSAISSPVPPALPTMASKKANGSDLSDGADGGGCDSALQWMPGPTTSTPATTSPSTRSPRPKLGFRCGKPGHRSAVCRTPSPMQANVTIANDVAAPKPGDNELVRSALLVVERAMVLLLHADGDMRSLRALLTSGATNSFDRAESLLVLPADMNIREGPGDMIMKYACGKRATFAFEFDGFRSSEAFLVIELSSWFDCVFGIPWLALHQPEINWLTDTVSPRDIGVGAVLAFLCGTPNQWPHVAVMNSDAMAHAAPEVSDGSSYAMYEHATSAGLEQHSQYVSDAVELGFPRPDEQRFSEEDDDVVNAANVQVNYHSATRTTRSAEWKPQPTPASSRAAPDDGSAMPLDGGG